MLRGKLFADACERARLRSLEPDYKGCSVNLNAVITMDVISQHPHISGYTLSDWTDGTTVRSYIDGESFSVVS